MTFPNDHSDTNLDLEVVTDFKVVSDELLLKLLLIVFLNSITDMLENAKTFLSLSNADFSYMSFSTSELTH